ncbi:MAG: glycosyltransferase family 61 protein [Chitinophagia bacterium]|nr:glycosyltransferase family 61 protein [Chitinophagia bacterium]
MPEQMTFPVNMPPDDRRLFEWVYDVQPQGLEARKYNNTFYINGELTGPLLGTISRFFPGSTTRFRKIMTLWKALLDKRFRLYLKEAVCIVSNPWSNTYYHWLAEVMPRLLEAKRRHGDVLFLFPFFFEDLNEQFQLPSVSQLRIRYQYLGETNFFARKIYFTQSLRPSTGHFPKGSFDLFRSFFRRDVPAFRKIYICRKAEKRIVANGEEVEACFLRHGYETVELENAGLEDQVRHFSEALVIASIHGAALTNMLFMREGSTVLEFGLKGERHDKCYFNMAREVGHRYFHLGCESLLEGVGFTSADLVVDIDALERTLTSISEPRE